MVLFAAGARAADVLFPEPLHITREVSDPFSRKTVVVDEYCHGNRIVSVSGRRTAIADHAKREMTVIDFAAGTYSVTPFEEIAKANGLAAQETRALSAAREPWRVEARGARVVASRPGEMFEGERRDGAMRQVIRVTADRQLKLNRAAAEALLGSAYPNRRDDGAAAVLDALRVRGEQRVATNAAPGERADEYFLPLEHQVAFEVEGDRIEARTVVVRVGSELPPPEVLAIPPGARLVESAAVASRRLLEELDAPVQSPRP